MCKHKKINCQYTGSSFSDYIFVLFIVKAAIKIPDKFKISLISVCHLFVKMALEISQIYLQTCRNFEKWFEHISRA